MASIYEQLASQTQKGVLNSILSSKKKNQKRVLKDSAISSFLTSALLGDDKEIKQELNDNIKTLAEDKKWEELRDKELYAQILEIKGVDKLFKENPDHFVGIATKDFFNSKYGLEITAMGGLNNLDIRGRKAATDLIQARANELTTNHLERMKNPLTTEIKTAADFSSETQKYFEALLNQYKDDPANYNRIQKVLRKFGIGKDKEIELASSVKETKNNMDQRRISAEAFLEARPLKSFVDYNVANSEKVFKVNTTLNLKDFDKDVTALANNLKDSDKSFLKDQSFNLPLFNPTLSYGEDVPRVGSSPFSINDMKEDLQIRRIVGQEKGEFIFKTDSDLLSPANVVASDIIKIEKHLEAHERASIRAGQQTTGTSKEQRYATAVEMLINNGRFRKEGGMFGSVIYIPLRTDANINEFIATDPTNESFLKLDGLGKEVDESLKNEALSIDSIYGEYLKDRTEKANTSNNFDELQTLDLIATNDKVKNEEFLKFVMTPPDNLKNTRAVINKETYVLGSDDKTVYNSLYENFKSKYGTSETLEQILNLEDSEVSTDTDNVEVPEPVIRDDLKPKTPSDIYYRNEGDRSPASLLTQSVLNRPVKTITEIDEVLDKIDKVDSVKDLKNFKSKIIKGIKDAYKEDTGERLVNINNLSLDDYEKYLTMYRASFIQDNQDLFQEPKSLLAGN